MSSVQVIDNFFHAIEANNKEKILGFFTEESVFDNVPMGPVIGPEAIWKVLATVHEQASDIVWDIHRLEQGPSGTVYSERTDRYLLQGQWAEFRCAGIHVVSEEGKILLWRDYFDMQQSLETMPG